MIKRLPQDSAQPEMTSSEVVDLCTYLEGLGLRIWIDGGWAVDALLGEQTRPHQDLDIAIDESDVPRLRMLLAQRGYRQVRADSKWNFVLGDDEKHEIDVHSFVRDSRGNISDGIKYPVESLTGSGVIAGQKVRCLSPEYVIKLRTGYELTDKDFKDVQAICKKFSIALPPEYAHLKD